MKISSNNKKEKSQSNSIKVRLGMWHILHNLIQCNANGESVAFVKRPIACVALYAAQGRSDVLLRSSTD